MRVASAVGLVVVMVVAACSAAAPSIVPLSTFPPINVTPGVFPTVEPSLPEETPAASDEPTPTPAPTPATGPTPSPKPTRTLAPGETPRGTPLDISLFLTAGLSLQNLAPGDVEIAIDLSDASSGKGGNVATLHLAPNDFIDQRVPAGIYRIVVTRVGSSAKPAACTIQVKDGNTFAVSVFEEDVAIVTPGSTPTSGDDLVFPTSPLCLPAGGGG